MQIPIQRSLCPVSCILGPSPMSWPQNAFRSHLPDPNRGAQEKSGWNVEISRHHDDEGRLCKIEQILELIRFKNSLIRV